MSQTTGMMRTQLMENGNIHELDYAMYDKYTVAQLKEMLRFRGLAVSGTKAELLDRLVLSHFDPNKPTNLEPSPFAETGYGTTE